MKAKLCGGCLCGQVRYTAADPVAIVVCHCTHCQKISGSAFSLNVLVADPNFALEGRTSQFRDVGDSGGSLERHFCANCGSSVFSKAEALAGLTVVKAGTLDDPSQVRPDTQIYCDSSQEWVRGQFDLKSFPKSMA